MTAAARRLRSPWLLASLAWIGLLLLFFFPVVFQGKVLAPLDILDHLMRPWSDGAGGFGVHNAFVYDAISQYLPYDWAVFQSIRQDGYIGWNPYVYGGYALLENTMLCPGDWHHQLYRFFDFWTAWDLGIILQFSIAGFGVLLMLRDEGLPAWAALVGAVSFAFYSQHVLWIYHRWVLGASCWFPWIVWAIRRARRKNRLVDFWSIAFTALAFRGGSLQSCLFVTLLVLGLFLADVWTIRKTDDRRSRLRLVASYATLSVGSTLLVSDVLLDTIPPFLDGCRELSHRGILANLKALPFLASTVFPAVFGTPQTMDVGKVFGATLFDLKYAGAIPLVLAIFAFRRKEAPLAPKIMAALSLGIASTPLVNWFYSRSTVVFGLGVAWLAAWQLANPRHESERFGWRWLARLTAAAVILWALVGGLLLALRPRIEPTLHAFVEKNLPADKATRLDWMIARSDAFLDAFPPWSLQNAPALIFVMIGLFAAWRLSRRPTTTPIRRWIPVLVLCAFGELFVWSRTWITFSPRPAGYSDLYEGRAWTDSFKRELSGGGYLYVLGNRDDFDFFQLNAQSGLGIPCLQGYETITPDHPPIPAPNDLTDLNRMARLGISHVLVRTGERPVIPPPAWMPVLKNSDFILYRNSSFESRWDSIQVDGGGISIRDSAPSPNRHRFLLPAGTVSVSLSEPFHASWKDVPPPSISAKASRRDDGGTLVTFDRPLDAPDDLVRSFQKTNPLFWLQLALLVLLALCHFTSFKIRIHANAHSRSRHQINSRHEPPQSHHRPD